MENVLISITLNEIVVSGTLELVEVTTERGTEYDITFVRLKKRYNVAHIRTKATAQWFYNKQMKTLIEKGVSDYFFGLEDGSI